MKWFIRIIGLIVLLFAGLCVVGFFQPATQTFERTLHINAFPEEVFYYVNDLREYERFGNLRSANPDVDIAYGGAESGVGQSAAWQIPGNPPVIGSQEIVESQPPEFVRTALNLNGMEASATYAIIPLDEGGVSILMRGERDLGGFPFIQRLTARTALPEYRQTFDDTLRRLKTVVEAENPQP